MSSAIIPSFNVATRGWAPPSVGRQVLTIALKELREALRNKWFLLFSLLFGGLASALSYLSMAGNGLDGMAGFGRTAAGLVNVVILIVPLMALICGSGVIAGERDRGTLEYLLSHPISRGELLLGKYLGAAVALLASLTLGFGVSMLTVARFGRGQEIGGFLALVIATYVLAIAMLSVGVLISVICRRSSVATGAAIVAWFALVFLTDLGLMGSAIVFRLRVEHLFHLSLINPMQVFKMSVLGSIHASLDVLGPAGTYATQTYGNRLRWLFAGAAAAWTALPAAAAYLIFARKGDA
jgi:Cu-processing system permease protein